MHLGHERVIGAWRGRRRPRRSRARRRRVETLLAAWATSAPRALLLTHIHLDHAGARGALVRRWPDLEVYVHERGAPHMADPAKLLASAARLYGDDMDRLWGEFAARPGENLHALSAARRPGDGLPRPYTPGHASHHVTYFHEPTRRRRSSATSRACASATAPVMAPTPPPDIDLEAWESLAAGDRRAQPAAPW